MDMKIAEIAINRAIGAMKATGKTFGEIRIIGDGFNMGVKGL